MLEMIKELSSLNGISGREDTVRDYIISRLPETAEYSVDAMGNLIVFVKGKHKAKNKVMLAAHMDEVGMIVTYINSDGFIKIANVGGIETAVQLGRRVKVGEKELTGVIGVTPIHLRRADDELKYPKKADELYIDVGAESDKELEGLVSPGDKIVFDSETVEFGSMLKGKALDDRAGCAAFAVEPDYAVVVETTTAADISGVSGEKQVCKLGSGAVVPFMDAGTVYSPELYKRANELAKEKEFKIQTKTVVAGGNDARSIKTNRGGVKTLTVSFATRYLHSSSCVIHRDDIAEMKKAVTAIAEEFANA